MKRKNNKEMKKDVIVESVWAVCGAAVACTFVKGAFKFVTAVVESINE